MIRRETEDGWVLISQHDHGILAGDIMKYWGNERFSRPEPSGEVLLAINEHDHGWVEWESSITVNPENGYPTNFMEMKSKNQSEIWSRSYENNSENHPYASSLIALHFDRFNRKLLERNPSDKSALSYKREMENFLAEHLDDFSCDSNTEDVPPDININLRLLQVGDIISLALCHGWTDRVMQDVPLDYEGSVADMNLNTADGFNFTIAPYPFSIPLLEVSVRGRRLRRKSFSSDEELRKCLESAEWITLDFTIGKG
jgi:hypothetical protein